MLLQELNLCCAEKIKMELYGLTIEKDLPLEAIIIWTDGNDCPAGFSKLSTSAFYIAVGDSYSTNEGQNHTHSFASHTHSWGATNTGAGGVSINAPADASAQYESHIHTVGTPTCYSANGEINIATPPGLQKYDVILCKKI